MIYLGSLFRFDDDIHKLMYPVTDAGLIFKYRCDASIGGHGVDKDGNYYQYSTSFADLLDVPSTNIRLHTRIWGYKFIKNNETKKTDVILVSQTDARGMLIIILYIYYNKYI